MISVVVIDDEKRMANSIARMIEENSSGFAIAGVAHSVKTGIELINKHKPDLITLDINLPDGSGFDILKQVEERDFKIIFITAYEAHALKAIKFSALDYFLKPIDELEFADALRKVKTAHKAEKNRLVLDALLTGLNGKPKEQKKIVLKTVDDIHLVKIEDIIRCESDGSYTTFYLTNKKTLLVSKNLKEYEDLLVDYGFFRVHHSHLINLNFIERFHKADGGLVHMTDQSEIPVSVRRKEKLLKLFSQL